VAKSDNLTKMAIRDVTKHPGFQKWFAGSQVHENGKPLVAYHGTTKDFDQFQTKRPGRTTTAERNKRTWAGELGSWFAAPSKHTGNYDEGNAEYVAGSFTEDHRPEAEYGAYQEGARILPVHLSIKNPAEYDGYDHLMDEYNGSFNSVTGEEHGGFPSWKHFRAHLESKGHDGVVIRNSMTDGDVDRDDWVAFHPHQIKSIHAPEFDPEAPQFGKSEAGDEVPPLPPAPGTAPLKPGHVRLYHQTDAQNLDGIRRDGLTLSAAKGIEGPKAIYATKEPFYGSATTIPTVEFQVPEADFSTPFVRGARRERVDPSDFIAIHEPWHDHARYAENDPEVLQSTLNGEHDHLLTADPALYGAYQTAIGYIKRKYTKPPMTKSEPLAKAGDTISALLTHPDPVERALALTLAHVQPQHVAQAELDPHPRVQAAVQRWKAKNTPPEMVGNFKVSHAQKNGTKYFFVHGTTDHEKALGMYAPEMSRYSAGRFRHLGHYLPDILGYVRYTGVPEGEMVVHETHAPWHWSPGMRGHHVASWLNDKLGTHHDVKQVEAHGQSRLSDLAHHGIITRVFNGKDPQKAVHDAFVDWSRSKGGNLVRYRPLSKSAGQGSFTRLRPLVKDTGFATFPKLGVDKVPTKPMVYTDKKDIERRVQRDNPQRARYDKQFVPETAERYQVRGAGAMANNEGLGMGIRTRSEKRFIRGYAVPGGNKGIRGIEAHEAQHSVFAHLGQEYGSRVRDLAAQRLLGALHPYELEHVNTMMSVSGYDTYSHPEEGVTTHLNYLQDPKWRAHVHKTLGLGDVEARHFHNVLKRTWKKMRAKAKTLTHDDLTSPDVSGDVPEP
jgi:hypothetical protein